GGAGGAMGTGGDAGGGGSNPGPSSVTTGGGSPESTEADGGCSCRTAGGSDRGWPWALLAFVTIGVRRRSFRRRLV
ncbi:MAG: MYXO-CTERM sorting domain-containing protein, partial [Planctomycetota bacterium]